VIGVVMRVDHVADRAVEAGFQEGLDGAGLFGKHQGIDQDRPFRGDDSSRGDLGIQFAGKDVNIIGDAFTLHNVMSILKLGLATDWPKYNDLRNRNQD